ncbi:hypothetical protein HOY82DRAFT_595410 [Tuber indicum]|nr:hypothetical protein HOY82DRAFT_595410 [Tuber indicum]
MSSYNKNLFCNNSSSNITNSNNTAHNGTTVNDEELRSLSRISPLELWKRNSDVAHARAKGVGEWIPQRSEFQSWQQDGNDPPVGRILFGPINTQPTTYTLDPSSLIIDTLCDGTASRNVTVGFLTAITEARKSKRWRF